MEIIMKYPKMDGNKLCDGSLHKIVPITLSSFYYNDKEYFLLDYVDSKFQQSCYTILKKEKNIFYKLPLKNYDIFEQKLESGEIKLKKEDLSMLDNITLIFAKEPINSLESVKNENINKIQENRQEQIDEIIKIYIDALIWENKIQDEIPIIAREALSNLRKVNIDELSTSRFELLLKELKERLKSCIHPVNDGLVILGITKVNPNELANVIYFIIDKYFNKNEVVNYEEKPKLQASADGILPPPPHSQLKSNPIYLSEKLKFIYSKNNLNSNYNNQEKKVRRYYIALKDGFFEEDNNYLSYASYIFIENNYSYNNNFEKELSFFPEYNYYQTILLDYLTKVKEGIFILNNPIGITIDYENKCYYLGYNREIENGDFIEYNFANCEKEKFYDILTNPIDIIVPDDCPYRKHSREAFIANTFIKGVQGVYSLSTDGEINDLSGHHLKYK